MQFPFWEADKNLDGRKSLTFYGTRMFVEVYKSSSLDSVPSTSNSVHALTPIV
jgi:hypothetical protein